MGNKNNLKAWLYLLPAIILLGVFMVYPLIDVFIYSFEEGYNFSSQTFFDIGGYNYSYVLHDAYFLQALKNTFILVIISDYFLESAFNEGFNLTFTISFLAILLNS